MKSPLAVLTTGAILLAAPHAAAAPPPEFLYVSNYGAGTVSAFRVDLATGALTEVAGSPFSAGIKAEDLVVDPTNRFLYVVHRDLTTFTAFAIGADGALTPLPGSPFPTTTGNAADPASVAVDPSGRFLYLADPLLEKIRGYTLDPATGVPSMMAGTGVALGNNADGLTVHPWGRFLYGGATNGAGGLSAYTLDPSSGVPTRVTGTPIPAGTWPRSTAADPSGRYLLAANHDGTVWPFSVHPTTGYPTPLGASAAGAHPSDVVVTPSGRFVYVVNESGGSVSAYALDAATGALSAVPGSPFAAGFSPSGVAVDPTNRFLYVSNRGSFSVSAYAIAADGALSALAGSPVPGDQAPSGTAMTSHDPIFADGFESGDLAAWSSASTDVDDLTVTAAAALHGAQGLQATVDDLAPLFVADDTPADEDRYRARFLLRPQAFDTGVAQGHHRARVLIGFRQSPQQRVLTLVLRYREGQYAVAARVLLDDGSRADTPFVPITNVAPNAVQVDWRRASDPDAGDGSLELFVDDVSVATLTGLDNHDAGLDFVRLGAMSLKAGASGTIRFDAFASRRYNFIWPTF